MIQYRWMDALQTLPVCVETRGHMYLMTDYIVSNSNHVPPAPNLTHLIRLERDFLLLAFAAEGNRLTGDTIPSQHKRQTRTGMQQNTHNTTSTRKNGYQVREEKIQHREQHATSHGPIEKLRTNEKHSGPRKNHVHQ